MTKTKGRLYRKIRIRKRVRGTALVPRLTVYRSNKHIFAQIVNDDESRTIVAVSSYNKKKGSIEGPKMKKAEEVGKLIALSALKKNISKVVFDRNGYLYHGSIKKCADAARTAGLKF